MNEHMSKTNLGEVLWDFLNDENIIVRMEVASKLNKPAIEAIDEILLNKFGDKIKENKYRHEIGRQVKEIMIARGYQHVKSGVKIKNNILFTTASRYEKK